MKLPSVALVFPANYEYADAVISGVADYLERERTFTPVSIEFLDEKESYSSHDLEGFEGIIGFTSMDLKLTQQALSNGIPFVNCGTDWLTTNEVLSVYVDQKRASKLAVSHFRSLGLEKVYYLSHAFENHPQARVNKAEDFCKNATKAGLETAYFELPGQHPKLIPLRLMNLDRETKLIDLIRNLPKPCGLFCEDDTAGAFACSTGLMAGCVIPDDMAVLGYGNEMTGRFASVPLSSFPTNAERVGSLAAELLSRWLATGKQPASPPAFDPLPIIVRESTGGSLRDIDLEYIRRQIGKRACEGLGLDELIERAGVTRKTLAVRYEQAFGETPSEAIRRVRYEKARQLLRRPVLENFSVVANACGFASLTSFSNFFRRCSGESPAEFRKRHL